MLESMPQDEAYTNEVYALTRRTKESNQAQEALKGSRYTLVGTGHSAVVVQDPDDSQRVLRVSKDPIVDGGVQFLDSINNLDWPEGAKKYLPRVVHRVQSDTVSHTLPKYIRVYEHKPTGWGHKERLFSVAKAFVKGMKDVEDLTVHYTGLARQYYSTGRFLKKCLVQLFPSVTVWDIHTGNVMYSPEQDVLVLTDPIARRSE